jgi:hypothetical protein
MGKSFEKLHYTYFKQYLIRGDKKRKWYNNPYLKRYAAWKGPTPQNTHFQGIGGITQLSQI